MEALTGSLNDSLYDLVPGHHPTAHQGHADTTHTHSHGRDNDAPSGLTSAHAPSASSRLTVLTTSHHDSSRGLYYF